MHFCSEMAKGKALSEFQRGKILAFKDQGLSNRKIAGKLNVSPTSVDNFVKNQQNYGKRRSYGRKSKLSVRETRRILRAASNSTKSGKQLKVDLGLNVSDRTIRNVINGSGRFKRARMKCAPAFRLGDKPKRLQFGRQNMNRNWKRVSCFLVMGLGLNFCPLGDL